MDAVVRTQTKRTAPQRTRSSNHRQRFPHRTAERVFTQSRLRRTNKPWRRAQVRADLDLVGAQNGHGDALEDAAEAGGIADLRMMNI